MSRSTSRRGATRLGIAGRAARFGALAAVGLVTMSCGGGSAPQTSGSAGPPASSPGQPAAVVALGDGATAGVGLLEAQSWPAQIQTRIDELGYDLTVVNAGLTGDTTTTALTRIDEVLQSDARILILAIGAEDVRRGVPAPTLQRNLAQMIEVARDRALAVLLVGAKAPPDFGPEYAATVALAYQDLAQRYRLVFVPDLLEGIAGHRDLVQADGLTPNAEGARLIADRIWLALQPMVDNLGGTFE